MTPINCPLCSNRLDYEYMYDYSKNSLEEDWIILDCRFCFNYKYVTAPSNHIETAIYNKYRIYNYYDLSLKNFNFAEIDLYELGRWQTLHSFDHNIIVNPRSIDRFLNLKAFL